MDNKFNTEYAKYYDLFNGLKDYRRESDFLESVFKKNSSFVVKNILDLGCGTGLHAKNLALRGYSIFGLDLSEEMIGIAKLRDIPNSEFVIGDIANFDLDKKFDACICMFASLGYLTKNKEIESCFKSIKKHLRPGGLFILDCWNGLGVIHELPTSRTKEIKSRNLRVIRTSFPKLDSVNHICNVHFVVKFLENDSLKKEYTEDHKIRFFFPQELKKYLEDAGFEVLEICKTFELNSKVDENSWNMVLILKLKQEVN